MTVLWQEPFTALSTRGEQKKLAAELDRLPAGPVASGPNSLQVQARALERRTQEGDPLGRIVIPRIGAKFVFVKGTASSDLRRVPATTSIRRFPA